VITNDVSCFCQNVSYRDKVGGCGMDSSGSGQGPKEGFCEQDNETLGSVKGGEILD